MFEYRKGWVWRDDKKGVSPIRNVYPNGGMPRGGWPSVSDYDTLVGYDERLKRNRRFPAFNFSESKTAALARLAMTLRDLETTHLRRADQAAKLYKVVNAEFHELSRASCACPVCDQIVVGEYYTIATLDDVDKKWHNDCHEGYLVGAIGLADHMNKT